MKILRRIELADFLGVVGLGLLSYGAGQMYAPLFFVVPGLCLMALAVFMASARS